MSKKEEKPAQANPEKGKTPLLAAIMAGGAGEKKVGETAPDKGKSPSLAAMLGGGGEGKKGPLAGAVSSKARLLKAASLVRTFTKLKGKNQSESASTHGSTLPTKYENSYRLEPEKNLQVRLIETEMNDILNRLFKKYIYNAETARDFSIRVAGVILDKVKKLGFARYKFVCNVTIAENTGQSMGFFSRCIWEPKFDTFATVTLEKENFYVIATVHAVYFD